MSGTPRPNSGYYDRNYRQSAALIRARRPYIFKNAVLGASITAFTLAVYAYTLNVVGQDEFEDVRVPEKK
ncbi:hypothetical protein QBC32DRAFT_126599 [Pseudoneurospora amorphoporcata]|uniref:Cytochrome c oxidase assembly factor 3 n=1 Tax=Pseudoneurospora amorphoporcata TaxID=241081 RepID=A0AAN6NZV4_9PEZI|nr:hypothetical protein QBC32DRAFT_126599 [Pseudoneurospora amorphoporcata]